MPACCSSLPGQAVWSCLAYVHIILKQDNDSLVTALDKTEPNTLILAIDYNLGFC